MPRRRFRDPDPQVRDRNMLDILGAPGLSGLSRVGGLSGGSQTASLVVRDGGREGAEGVQIEHVTLQAVASQTIASGGGTVQFDTILPAPTEVRGFDTLQTDLAASGSVGDIPCDVGGFVVVQFELPFASTVDVDSWKAERVRNGIATTFLAELSGTGKKAVRGPAWGRVEPDDVLRFTLDPSADVDLGSPAWVQIGIWRLASATSSTTETLWLDTAVGDTASESGPVTSETILASGVTYTLLVDGNFRAADASTGADAMLYPSAGEPDDELANLDADFKYEPGDTRHLTSFQMDLGSGFSHVEPDGGAATSAPDGHLYTYTVTGEGSALSVRDLNAPVQNNGQLRIRIYRGVV